MANVIKVENLSKAYQLGQIGTGTLSRDLERWWALKRGKEDPFLKIGEANDRASKGSSDVVWSLKDINFEIKQGDAVGIIGRNGAGKSTLLKILSRVTAPTTGRVKVKGRIASLLEVGTGFHPELTGSENIFLNGAILGMRRKEIQRKFDEIVDFAGIERYVDTPVKRYSSGMYVRLAFAVAAHLESEIMIVDEVLAVGDAEFQKKCLGKMGEVSRGEGRTVLFVSHNMGAIRKLCTEAVLMNQGKIQFLGDVEEATKIYLATNIKHVKGSRYQKEQILNNAVEVLEAVVRDKSGTERSMFEIEEDVYINLRFAKNVHIPNTQGYLVIKNTNDEALIESDTFDFLPNIIDELEPGIHDLVLKIPRRVLPNGRFFVYLNFTSESSLDGFTLDSPKEILDFEVSDTFTKRGMNRKALTNCIIKWDKIPTNAE